MKIIPPYKIQYQKKILCSNIITEGKVFFASFEVALAKVLL